MRILVFATVLAAATAFITTPPQPLRVTRTACWAERQGEASRRDIFKIALAGAIPAVLLPLVAEAGEVTLPSGLTYSVIETGNGPTPKVGELVAVRFTGSYKGQVFDDLFKTAEPLYFRAGVGTVVPGIDEAVLLMKVGDRWKLTLPGNLGFGQKGRPQSPGKARIPPNATVEYEIQLVALPGREEDFIAGNDVEDFVSQE